MKTVNWLLSLHDQPKNFDMESNKVNITVVAVRDDQVRAVIK